MQEVSFARTHDDVFQESWHEGALGGCELNKAQMFEWVYNCALRYYLTKSLTEPLLGKQDAQDLASECIIEFSKSWPRIRCVSHYCRRMFKNNLHRFLKKRRREVNRDCSLTEMDAECDSLEASLCLLAPAIDVLSDDDEKRLRFVKRELQSADDVVQTLFKLRVFEGPFTYREIAEQVDASETSLRMKMARFNRKVRDRYARQHAAHRMSPDTGGAFRARE